MIGFDLKPTEKKNNYVHPSLWKKTHCNKNPSLWNVWRWVVGFSASVAFGKVCGLGNHTRICGTLINGQWPVVIQSLISRWSRWCVQVSPAKSVAVYMTNEGDYPLQSRPTCGVSLYNHQCTAAGLNCNIGLESIVVNRSDAQWSVQCGVIMWPHTNINHPIPSPGSDTGCFFFFKKL